MTARSTGVGAGGADRGGGERPDREVGRARVVARSDVGLNGADRGAVGERAAGPGHGCLRAQVDGLLSAGRKRSQRAGDDLPGRCATGRQSIASRPAGSVSVTTTFVAGSVPEFEATSRKAPKSPTATGSMSRDALRDPDVDGAGRERLRVAVVEEVVGVPEEVREGNDRNREGGVGHLGAGAVRRQRGRIRDHAVLPGTELGDVAGDDREVRAGRCADALAGGVEATHARSARDRYRRRGLPQRRRQEIGRGHVHRPGAVALDGHRVGDRAAGDRLFGREPFVSEMSAYGSVEISAEALLSSGLISVPTGADTVAVLPSSAPDG